MDTFVHWMECVLRQILITLMALITLSVGWQVASRYILADPASWTDEAARFSLTWVAMLGGVYVYSLKQHLAVTILPERWAGKRRGVFLNIFTHVVALWLGIIALVGGAIMTESNFANQQVSAVLHINMGFVYAAVPVSGVLFIIYALRFMVQDVQRLYLTDAPIDNALKSK